MDREALLHDITYLSCSLFFLLLRYWLFLARPALLCSWLVTSHLSCHACWRWKQLTDTREIHTRTTYMMSRSIKRLSERNRAVRSGSLQRAGIPSLVLAQSNLSRHFWLNSDSGLGRSAVRARTWDNEIKMHADINTQETTNQMRNNY